MTVTPIRLGPVSLPVTNAAGETSICSPAAGTAVIVKHIQTVNTDPAATHYFCLSIGVDAQGTRIVDQAAIAAQGEYARFVAHVLKNPDILCCSADTASKLTMTIRGDLLSSP